ncbi:MAG TPA: hypothetical protein VIH90_03765 [Candidatus Saccharimonadales bacterium]
MSHSISGGVPEVDVRQSFESGDFDYLPDVAKGIGYRFLATKFLVDGTYPSDECIPSMPDATIENLAEENLRTLAYQRDWRSPTKLALFAAIKVKRGLALPPSLEEIGYVDIKQAVVLPHNQIKGRITGPNRKMLDLVFEDLGITDIPEQEVKHEAETLFGGPLIRPGQGVESMGTPKQVQTNRQHTVPIRGTWRITGNYLRRAKIDEIEIEYLSGENAGQIDSAVMLRR